MAQAPALDQKESELFDSNLENTLLTKFISLGLNVQDKDEKPREWTNYNTKDKRICVQYTQLPDDDLYTIRGSMAMDFESFKMDDFYQFTQGGYNDMFEFQKGNDPMCTSVECIKHIDDNHSVIYAQFNPGMGLWPRDFCYMKKRFKYDKYQLKNNGDSYQMTGDLCYSIDEKHSLCKQTAKGFVRGFIFMAGYLFYKKLGSNDAPVGNYIVKTTIGGWIPNWIANLVAPDQGMVIKHVYDNYPKITLALQQRAGKNKSNDDEKDTKQENKTKQSKGAKGNFIEDI